MARCTLTEQEIIEGLRDAARRDRVTQALYADDEVRHSVFGFVLNRQGTPQQATQVFDYAFGAFDRHVRHGHYKGETQKGNNWRKYLANIAYNGWNWKSYDRNTADRDIFTELKDYDVGIDPIQETDIDFWERAKRVLDTCGEFCFILFKLTVEGYNDKDIAGQLGISHDSVRDKKRTCRAKFRDFFGKNNPF